ncbi:ribosomal protein S5 domain 2-type protein [Fomitopsis serialis]|uniref:ribosomal protein S5 domain 2-type protein n=1 Tax=Fomitopsis serialis TaxID=139415 RepID=UPI002007D67C|nr:ribosomal protein S5 domain 2-type protein [Neoantrodia serialis]KAH9920041.1 ribosomal protein S5 domain 2-type protein [Neoantrodia serialis]
MTTTAVSAPGKVLLAGGYLVLDPAYSGVVVSTSARFYTTVRDLDEAASVAAAKADRPIEIRVRSPQFVNATWIYFVVFDGEAVRVEQVADIASSTSSSKNKFVHLALQRTLSLALEARGAGALQNSLSYGLDITIAGDNDFYSQRAQLAAKSLPPTLASLAQLPPFAPTGVQLADVHKTGLGSSAALITSLVSSLLVHLRVIPSDSFAGDAEGGTVSASDGRKLAHNLAQYVHCLAQGKVGSGFDVSAAVFGSQLYTRFDPGVIAPLMSDNVTVKLLPTISTSNKEWNHRVEPFRLPPLTRLMLADVDAGSDTPSLVGKVLKWRKEDSGTANDLWNALDKVNHAFSKTLLTLSDLHAQDTKTYAKAVKYLSTLQTVQWLVNPNISGGDQEIMEAFAQAHQYSEDVRAKMREMGTLSGVPIEPPEQTELLNACVSGAGVIGGGVPGAGGYDAIWLLVLDPEICPPEELPSARVERVWAGWKGLDVSPLSASESVAKGVRLEDVAGVKGLKDLVDAPW